MFVLKKSHNHLSKSTIYSPLPFKNLARRDLRKNVAFLSGKTKLSVINVCPYSGVPLHILHSATVKIEIHNKKYTNRNTQQKQILRISWQLITFL